MSQEQTPIPAPGQPYRRKIHYIDHVLQKWMLIALVLLEIVVISAAGAVLYFKLNAIVDANLYRIHFTEQTSMFTVLFKESSLILGGMLVANLVALLVADRIWTHYVQGILRTLRDLLNRTRDLDFRPDADVPQRHNVIALALVWRDGERERHRALRALLVRTEQGTTEDFRSALIAMRKRLPPVRASKA